MSIKEKLYNKCIEFIDNRLLIIQNTILEIQESLLSETKSSAGDKHETGRAMLQLEREKTGNQLAEINKMRAVLNRVQVDKSATVVALGSLVYTNQLNYFIAVSAGKLEVNGQSFYAISSISPIGKLLLGKSINDMVVFNGKNILIQKIE